MRRLQITRTGFWYIALSIALGVVAIASGNNVIYLLDSLLLSGMIFSGILSERIVSRVHVERVNVPVCAGSPARDRVLARNSGKTPAFCVEVGEWKGRRFVPIAYIPRLGPGEKLVVSSTQLFENRGSHDWHGLAVATAFPFGFARKLRVEKEPGQRLIWPRRAVKLTGLRDSQGASPRPSRRGQEFAEGEVRPMVPDDDSRAIIWTLSAKGGDPMVRPRRSDQVEPEVTLDLRIEEGDEFERNIIQASEVFHQQEEGSSGGTLTLLDHQGSRKFHGKTQALNQLALLAPTGLANRRPNGRQQ